jgi:two-component system sensor histidine kinase KdpD
MVTPRGIVGQSDNLVNREGRRSVPVLSHDERFRSSGRGAPIFRKEMVWPARLKESIAPAATCAGALAAVPIDGAAEVAALAVAVAAGGFAVIRANRSRDAAVATADRAAARERESAVVAQTAGALLAGTPPADTADQLEQALAQMGARLQLCHAPAPRPNETALPLKARGTSGWLYVDRDGPLTREQADRLVARIKDLIAVAAERTRKAETAADAEAARQAELAKTSIMHAVAHDLRKPVATLAPAAAALQDDRLSPEERMRLADTVSSEAAQLERMVDDLLDLSRIAAGAVNPQPEWCDLNEIVGTAVERVAHDRDDCSVRAALPTDLPRVHADRAQLERVFQNLIENATKFSPAERPAEVRGICANGRVTIRILDHGRGIPLAQQSQVFKPFVRGSDTASGNGLGLAICRGFVEANGGRIALQSGTRDGSAFTVSFPVAKEPSPVG